MNLPTPLICDAIKIAYRQSKDGFVVSFAIHPQDMPADLANADIGSQWQIRLVGLDEDGNPKSDDAERSGSFRSASREAAAVNEPPPASKPRPVIAPDKRLTQRAGILCNDPDFQLWLRKTNNAWQLMNLGTAADKAAELVRVYCGVGTRKDIIPGTPAGMLFDEMLGKYAAWQACLEDAS